ncbi:MAG: hybrid sensor histidine kinase/response regulator [Gemmatimonadaceae bacterium]|nr:hybrid sensor histidine kinase/response regulator [Gloeobacterales cyanobacterium ES-bin-141]
MQPEAHLRILGYFIEEARDHLATLEQGVLELRRPQPTPAAGRDTPEDNLSEQLKELFRAAHSLKGGAAMLGLQSICTIAHRFEDNLKLLQDSPVVVSQALEGCWLQAVDILQGLFVHLQASGNIDDATEALALAEAEHLMLQIERYLLNEPEDVATAVRMVGPLEAVVIPSPKLDAPEEEFMGETALGADATTEVVQVEEVEVAEQHPPASSTDILSLLFASPEGLTQLSPDRVAADRELVAPNDSTTFTLRELPDAVSRKAPSPNQRRTLKVDVRLLDNLNNQVGELIISRNSLETQQGRLRSFFDILQVRARQLDQVNQRLTEYYDHNILGIYRGGAPSGVVASSNHHTSSSPGHTFDALEMDQYTAFHSMCQEIMELIVRVREVTADIGFVTEESDEALRQLRQISLHLQGGLNQIRLLPLAEIVDRLPRAVRDLSAQVGKEADLILEGRNTLIDKAILEELYDPLTHLTTNALMHGIEEPQVRRELGKPTKGRIEVRASHQGNQTVIAVCDDGHGLNTAQIRARAVEKGFLSSEQAAHIADVDLYPFIFKPGFSTAEQVSEIAGRGVGLDIVQKHLARLRGSIQVDSRPTQGTTFTIRLPLTLSISQVVICLHRQSLLGIPLDGIEEMIDLPVTRVHRQDNQPYIQWRGQDLRLVPLIELLPYSRLHRPAVEHEKTGEPTVSTVILRNGDIFLAIEVDEFREEKELVIKQLQGPIERPVGIAGVSVLGNGKVLPIIDTHELMALITGQLALNSWGQPVQPMASRTRQVILIIDDSITVRELLSMTFSKVGYRVEQARDALEALEKLRNGLECDAIFCDVEMPRMDGFEFLSQLQKDSRLCSIPVAMLTSRNADKHRQTAYELGAQAYFTKPYLEEELLQGALRLLQTTSNRSHIGV